MIAQLFNFGIVFLAFYLLAAKPLRKLMKERGDLIEKGLDDAKLNSEVLEKTKKEYEEVLAKARVEAQKISGESKKEVEIRATAMIEQAKNEVQGIVESGKKTLEAEKIRTIEETKGQIAELGILVARKIMEETNHQKT